MVKNFSRPFLMLAFAGMGLASFAQTSVKEVPNGWHLRDRQASGYYGISMDKAYDFVKGKKSTPVIVAVIDSGVDTTHEDLRSILWTNTKEIPGNGIDDDKNGYIDDVHGWNFLGNKDGRNVKEDSYEAARVYHQYKSRFETLSNPSSLSKDDQALYQNWLRAKDDVTGAGDVSDLPRLQNIYDGFRRGDSIIKKEMNKPEYSGKDLQAFTTQNRTADSVKRLILTICAANNNNFDITNNMLLESIEGDLRKLQAIGTPPTPYRAMVVKDNENDISDKYYGNNDIMASTPFHGTHVSGIIAAVRNNGKGIDGIADNVRIMTVRAVPDGDEHDKDIALAIRYAVDNGAKVINMSFGKSFSPQKQWVDDAVKYAESKGVLLVHAAGNDAKNLDSSFNFPTPDFIKGGTAPNWVTVGASGDPGNGGLTASFSNYGKQGVDLFAPGVNIYSSVPGGNTYGNASGTSMASPVTAGVAAFLLEYYPKLTPKQIRMILDQSAVKPDMQVNIPGTEEKESLSDLSQTGGLLNAYEAVKLAAEVSQNGGKMKNTNTDTKIKVKKPA